MKKWARRTAQVGAIAAGLVFAAAGTASASGPHLESSGNSGVGVGNNVVAPIQIPVNVCGNGVGGAGLGVGGNCPGGDAKAVIKHFSPHLSAKDNSGVVNGNNAVVPVQAPINFSSNGIGIFGAGIAGNSKGGSDAVLKKAPAAKRMAGPSLSSDGNSGILTGNNVVVPVQVPVNVCGNGVGGAGLGVGGNCPGGDAKAKLNSGGLGSYSTDMNSGVGVGNNVYVPIQVPVNFSSNGIGIFGAGVAGNSKGGATAVNK